MDRIAEDVFVETGYAGANVGIIRSHRGLILIDSPHRPADAVDLGNKLRSLSSEGVLYAIATDHHCDHVSTSGYFCPRIVIQEDSALPLDIMRAATRERPTLLSAQSDILGRREAEAMQLPAPFITFRGEISFHLGSLTVRVTHAGGHTLGTCFVHVPEAQVVFCGDNLTTGGYPYLVEGAYRTWAAALRTVMSLDVRMVVPGHGEVGDKESAATLVRFFESLEERVKELFAGKYNQHHLPASTGELAGYFPKVEGWPLPPEETRAETVRRMYEQLTGEAWDPRPADAAALSGIR